MIDKIEKWLEEKLSGKYYVQDFIRGFSAALILFLLFGSIVLSVVTLSPWLFILNIVSPVLVGIVCMVG